MVQNSVPDLQPLLSVVVVIVSDTTDVRADASHLAGCLDALHRQVDSPSMEVIVPYKPPVEGIERLKEQYTNVTFIYAERLPEVPRRGGSREHHDELRACGLVAARGEIVALLEDHARPDLHWAASIIEAHRRYSDYAAIGGAIENDVDRILNWAVFFCDFGKYQNPVPEGETSFASDANVSYKRSALECIEPVWQATFSETKVNWALRSAGKKLALTPAMIVYQHRANLGLSDALKERFIWGRSYAAGRSCLCGPTKRLFYAALTPVLPALLLARMSSNIAKKRRNAISFFKALPLIGALTASWAGGEMVGYLSAFADGSAVTAQTEEV